MAWKLKRTEKLKMGAIHNAGSLVQQFSGCTVQDLGI
jgi:hypothetical protein